jgi:hypothetical protein
VAKVQAIPKDYHTVTRNVVVDGAAKAIDFDKKGESDDMVQSRRVCTMIPMRPS